MNKVALLILVVISFAASRLVFSLVNDPEGPNLLVVTVLAIIIFAPLSLINLLVSKRHNAKK